MRTDDFWAVIETAGAPDGTADPKAVAEQVTELLAARDAATVVAWSRHLDRVMAASLVEDLWAAAYLINGGCSDEGFDDFRGWLVAQGRAVVAGAVRAPDSLAGLPAVRAAAADGTEIGGGAVLHAADEAHRRLTGAELPAAAPAGPVDTGQFWDFDDADEMARRLPRLSALFLEPPAE